MYNENLNLLNDEELVDLVQKHKYKAFRELVTRYSSDLFNFSYHFVYNVDKTKELTEKLFKNIWQQPYLYTKDTKLSINIGFKLVKEILSIFLPDLVPKVSKSFLYLSS